MTEKKLISFLFLVFSFFSPGVVDGYRIYYGSSNEGPYPNLLAQVRGTTTEYTATLDEGLTYYLVALAYNDYGESGNSNEVKWPSGYQNQPPGINTFTAEPPHPIILGVQVIFRAQATDADGDPLTYTISFGDGTSEESGNEVVHTYTAVGTYTATLTVTDSSNAVDTATMQIIVAESSEALYINFQPADAPVPEGFLPDSGGYFDETAGYGWTAAPASHGARDRDNPISPDQAYDTMIHVAPSAAWEMAVPNGTYMVTVCVGDPSFPNNIQSVQVEGISVIDQEPLDRSQLWIEREEVVDVTDGRLTLTFDGCDITRLCYVLCEGGW
jgi:PKD repeat protein